jgi:hypothetical protein
MKRFALLSSLCLFAGLSAAHASSIGPLTDGYGITVGNTVLTSANTSLNSLTGALTFNDGTSTFTFIEANTPPVLNALSITRTCITLGALGANGCGTETVSVSNASLFAGTIQVSALVGASVQASAQAGISNLVFASTNLGLAAETAVVGAPPATLPVNSPVPEPGTISLVLSGALGVAAAARRRLIGA